jgi:hypothetical protein
MEAPILFVAAACVQRGGFLPRRFVHVRFGHADGLRWWLGRARRVSSGKRRTSGRSFSALAFDSIRVTFLLKVAKIVTDYG